MSSPNDSDLVLEATDIGFAHPVGLDGKGFDLSVSRLEVRRGKRWRYAARAVPGNRPCWRFWRDYSGLPQAWSAICSTKVPSMLMLLRHASGGNGGGTSDSSPRIRGSP